MMEENEHRVLEWLARALEVPAAERLRFLASACDDDNIRSRVEAMLREAPSPGAFDDLVARLEDGPDRPLQVFRNHTIEKYELRDCLGAGGMGVVFRAFDLRLKRVVALKFLRDDLTANPEAKARLLVEAQAAAGLEHPNICTIYEVGETAEGQLYFAMPCYEGETLRAKIERGPMPVAEAVRYVRQVAAGLERAHAAGIVHRDIKPANLLVTPDDVVKILDFGVAKRSEDQLTAAGSRLGTLAYMSPEQLRGEEVDHRADIWALGVVLFELLAGERPFRGEYEYALMYALLNQDPVSLQSLNLGLEDYLDATIMRALQKTAGDRWPSATAFIESLNRVDAAPEGRVAVAPTRFAVDRPVSEEGERRQAVILASSITGYFDLAEELPSDRLNALLSAFERDVERVAADHGGVIYRFSGEDMIILFGVPEGHEDDGMRAARTAKALHATAGQQSLALQSAISSGTLIARASSTERLPFEVTGPMLGLARRMVTLGDEGHIVVDGETARLIRPRFDVTERGTVSGSKGGLYLCF